MFPIGSVLGGPNMGTAMISTEGADLYDGVWLMLLDKDRALVDVVTHINGETKPFNYVIVYSLHRNNLSDDAVFVNGEAVSTAITYSQDGYTVYDVISVGEDSFRSLMCSNKYCCPDKGRNLASVVDGYKALKVADAVSL